MLPYFENNNSDFIVSLRNPFSFPLHLHTQLELVAVREGALQVLFGAGARTLRPGDLAVFFPNTVHGYRQTGAGVIQMLICGTRYAGDFEGALSRSHPDCPVLQSAALHPDIPLALEALAVEPEGSPARALWLQLLLCRALSAMPLSKNNERTDFDLTHRVLSYLSQFYRTPLSLEELARAVNASKYQLSRFFSGKLKTSFRDYVNQMRIRDAQRALRVTDLPVTQICFDCGFESQRTFNRAFLSQCGMTPRAYRAAYADQTGQKDFS